MKKKTSTTNAGPLVITVDGAPHTVRVGDFLYYSTVAEEGVASICVHKVRVEYASAAQLRLGPAFGLSMRVIDRNSRYNPQTAFVYYFDISEVRALRRCCHNARKDIEIARQKEVQAKINIDWCLARVEEIEKAKS